jgi:hypothetical protein
MLRFWARISGWKWTLVSVGLAILLVSMWYTNYLAVRLSDGERERLDVIVRAHQELSNIEDLNADISFYADILCEDTGHRNRTRFQDICSKYFHAQ